MRLPRGTLRDFEAATHRRTVARPTGAHHGCLGRGYGDDRRRGARSRGYVSRDPGRLGGAAAGDPDRPRAYRESLRFPHTHLVRPARAPGHVLCGTAGRIRCRRLHDRLPLRFEGRSRELHRRYRRVHRRVSQRGGHRGRESHARGNHLLATRIARRQNPRDVPRRRHCAVAGSTSSPRSTGPCSLGRRGLGKRRTS